MAARHGRITLTDRRVQVSVLVSPAEPEDLEDALALARPERDRALGRSGTPVRRDEARREPGVDHRSLSIEDRN